MKRDIQFVRAIDVPYEKVRDHLRDRAASLLGDGSDPIRTTLTTRIHGTDISRDVTMQIVGFDEPASAVAGAHLMFSADASRHTDLFPHLEARLDAIPVTDQRTALFMIATYKPPLGVIGGAVNALGLHRLAQQSLDNLFDHIANQLQG